MEETFWLVWNPSRGMPTVRHPSALSARKEAERLAVIQPGEAFYVLQAVARAESMRPVEYTILVKAPI